MNWYGLHVRSQAEQLVVERLAAAGIESFYPHVMVKSRDKRRDVIQKFMPGYVFSRFDLAEKTPVIAIPHVVAILGCGRHAIAIPDREVEAVKLIVSFPKLAAPSFYVSDGDLVRVCRGPLAGLEGYVVYSKSATRVIVSVEMLQRSISAEVDANSLEVLQQPQKAA